MQPGSVHRKDSADALRGLEGTHASVVALQEWQRASHGTGMGCSSTGGFWMPDTMPQPPSPPSSPAHGSNKVRVRTVITSKSQFKVMHRVMHSMRLWSDSRPSF